jgi:hypothetical protein
LGRRIAIRRRHSDGQHDQKVRAPSHKNPHRRSHAIRRSVQNFTQRFSGGKQQRSRIVIVSNLGASLSSTNDFHSRRKLSRCCRFAPLAQWTVLRSSMRARAPDRIEKPKHAFDFHRYGISRLPRSPAPLAQTTSFPCAALKRRPALIASCPTLPN